MLVVVLVFNGHWVTWLCGFVDDGPVFHLGLCAKLGSEDLFPFSLSPSCWYFVDMLQYGDGLMHLGAHLLSPMLDGGDVHGHFLEGSCGLCCPVALVQKLFIGGCEFFSAGVCCEVFS